MKTGSEIIKERYRTRNEKILELADKGWKHKSIAAMFKIKNVGTVSMVIWRARRKCACADCQSRFQGKTTGEK